MKVVAKRKWRYPMSLERQYAKQLVAYVKRKFAVIDDHRQEIIDIVAQYAVRTDDDSLMENVSAQISVLLDRIERDMESADDLTRAMNNMFDAVNRYNASEFNALTKSLFGFPLRVPVSQISHTDSAGRYRTDATLDDDISTLKMAWVRQNLALIKSIDADTMRRIEDKMMERIIANVSMGDLTKYLIKDIRDIAGVEVNRATLIGVDQVGKLNGRLTQYRQEHAGISEYQWETALDSRVRPSHRPRQGKIYKWSNPPPDGHPGYPIRCRCVALPVIDLGNIPILPKKGSYQNVNTSTNSSTSGIINIKEKLCESTSKLQATMPEVEYNEYLDTVANNEVVRSLYLKYADKIDGIVRKQYGGVYSPSSNTLEYSFEQDEYIESGINKYSTLAHEYSHFFDRQISNSKIHFTEIETIKHELASDEPWVGIFLNGRFPHKASFSDEFLKALRLDKEELRKKSYEEICDELRPHDASAGVQDAYDGFFIDRRIGWGHGENYYNRIYKLIKQYKLHNKLKKVYKDMGLDAKNLTKVKEQCRIYDAASEAWANILSAVTNGGQELEYVKKYLPNGYQAALDILKEE